VSDELIDVICVAMKTLSWLRLRSNSLDPSTPSMMNPKNEELGHTEETERIHSAVDRSLFFALLVPLRRHATRFRHSSETCETAGEENFRHVMVHSTYLLVQV
jgi:hypothetical protein